MGEEDPAEARRRIEEEMAKIQATTQQKRIQKMKELVGDTAEPIPQRRQDVKKSHQQFVAKGTREEEKKKADLEQLLPTIQTENNIQTRKQAYVHKLEEFSHKGKEHLLADEGGETIASPLRKSPTSLSSSSSPVKTYQAMAKQNVGTPTLFAYDPVQDANQRVAALKLSGTTPTNTANNNNNTDSNDSNNNNPLTPKGWDGKTFYTLVDLRQRRVPKDIDWKNREQYLSPSDFMDAFGMTKMEFSKQPKWKRDKLKQKLYLF